MAEISAIKRLPFKLNRDKALEIFRVFHYRTKSRWQSLLLAPTSSQLQVKTVRRVLLPFYHFHLAGINRIEALVPYSQSTSRRWMFDRKVGERLAQHSIRFNYESHTCSAMQISGTHAFPVALMDPLKIPVGSGWSSKEASDLCDMDDPKLGETDGGSEELEVLPFSVDLSTAISEQIEPFLTSREQRRSEIFLKAKYPEYFKSFLLPTTRPEHERDFRYRLEMAKYEHSYFYLPCFVVESEFMGREPVLTFIDGYSGRVAGLKHIYNPYSVASFVGCMTVCASVPVPTATLKQIGLWTSWNFVIPFMISSALTQSLPAAQLMWHGMRLRLALSQQTQDIKTYDPADSRFSWDIKKVGQLYSDWKRRETEEQRAFDYQQYRDYMHSMGQTSDSGAANSSEFSYQHHPDHLGYYQLLGVSPEASSEEIQMAFRRLAVKFHPDKQREINDGDGDDETSAGNFQKISEAYSVLRDDRLRRRYDLCIPQT